MALQVEIHAPRGDDSGPRIGCAEGQGEGRHRDRMRIVCVHDPDHAGLVIAGVSPEAAQAGLQPGDLLLGIDSASVSTVADVTVAANRSHKPVALLVQRGGRKVYVPLRW